MAGDCVCEKFRYETEEDRVEQSRASVETVAQRFNLKTNFTVTPDGKGNAAIEVSLVGERADLDRMRGHLIADVSLLRDIVGASGNFEVAWVAPVNSPEALGRFQREAFERARDLATHIPEPQKFRYEASSPHGISLTSLAKRKRRKLDERRVRLTNTKGSHSSVRMPSSAVLRR